MFNRHLNVDVKQKVVSFHMHNSLDEALQASFTLHAAQALVLIVPFCRLFGCRARNARLMPSPQTTHYNTSAYLLYYNCAVIKSYLLSFFQAKLWCLMPRQTMISFDLTLGALAYSFATLGREL